MRRPATIMRVGWRRCWRRSAATTLAAANEWHARLAPARRVDRGSRRYYVNVHRDWVWGRAETDAMYGQVMTALGDHRAGPRAGARRRRGPAGLRSRVACDRRRRRRAGHQSVVRDRRRRVMSGRTRLALRISAGAPSMRIRSRSCARWPRSRACRARCTGCWPMRCAAPFARGSPSRPSSRRG